MIVKLKPNQTRANNAILLLWIALAVTTVMLFMECYNLLFLNDIANGRNLDMRQFYLVELISIVVTIVYGIVMILCAVFFIMWFRRAYYNLHQFRSNLSYSEGWAAGAWFVPIMNWFAPFKIMNDLYRNTSGILLEKEDVEVDRKSHRIKNFWWALWISSSIIGNLGYQVERKAETIDALTVSAYMDILSSILSIGAAYCAVQVTKKYAEMEKRLVELENFSQSISVNKNNDLLDDII